MICVLLGAIFVSDIERLYDIENKYILKNNPPLNMSGLNRRIKSIQDDKARTARLQNEYPERKKSYITSFRNVIKKYGIETVCVALDCQSGAMES